jgi:hypothetical protein
MYMGLGRVNDLSLVCHLTGCSEWTFGQRLFDSSLMEVAQSSFPNFPMAHNHWNQCCAQACGNCAECHYSEEALGLHLALEFFPAAQDCRNAGPPTC